VGAAAFFCGIALLVAHCAIAAPFVPTDPNQILEKLAPRTGPDWEAIAALRAELARRTDCRDCRSAIAAQIVERYLALFRAQGDPRLVAYAERELEPWSAERDPPISIALQRAEIAQLMHRFDAARAELERLLGRTPRDGQAWLTLAAIDLTRGDYAASRAACSRLVLLQDAVVAGGCLAAARAVTGDAGGAYQFLEGALREPDGFDPVLAVWLETLAAETAEALGRGADAARHYRAALDASGAAPSVYLLVDYADFLLREGHPRAAIELLAGAPPADPVLLRLALAERRTGASWDALREQLGYRLQLALDGLDRTHAREAAYFALYLSDDPRRALDSAVANWAVQREPVDARLLLEAALAAGRRDAAYPVVEWLDANRVEHADLERLRARLGS